MSDVRNLHTEEMNTAGGIPTRTKEEPKGGKKSASKHAKIKHIYY